MSGNVEQLVAGDAGIELTFDITNQTTGLAVDLTGYEVKMFFWSKTDQDTPAIELAGVLDPVVTGRVKVVLTAETMADPGNFYSELQFTKAGKVQTIPQRQEFYIRAQAPQA